MTEPRVFEGPCAICSREKSAECPEFLGRYTPHGIEQRCAWCTRDLDATSYAFLFGDADPAAVAANTERAAKQRAWERHLEVEREIAYWTRGMHA